VKYRYDNIGQLKVADSSVAAEDRGYVYDAAGNLAWRTNNGTVGAFEVDTVNQLTSDAEGLEWYDANGNLIWRVWGEDPYWWLTAYLLYEYRYDDENRLIMVISYDYGQAPVWRTEFVYDGMGRRREQIEYEYSEDFPGGTETGRTRYVYDGKRVIQERDGGNTPLVSYTRGNDLSGTLEGAGGIGGLLARSGSYSSGNWTNHAFYHADGNGNITCMVNTNQTVVASYRYDPFGKTISQSGSLADANVYRFSLKEFHAVSGMYYYLYRFYDPNLQRWLNRDPIGEEGGINLYGFVGNDPVSWIDLFGFDRASCLNDCFNQLADCLSARNAILGTGVSTVGGGIIAGGHQTAGGAQKWLCRAGRATSYGRGLAFGTGVGFIIGATPWVVDCYSSYFGCRSGCPDPPKCPSSPPAPAGPPGPPNCNQNAPPSRLSFPL
jgi:RHS repeat-associated protein